MKTALYFVVLLICAGAVTYLSHETTPETAANSAAMTVLVITGIAALIGMVDEGLKD